MGRDTLTQSDIFLALRKWLLTELVWPRCLMALGFSLALFYLTTLVFGVTTGGLKSLWSFQMNAICATLFYLVVCMASYKSPLDEISGVRASKLPQLGWESLRLGVIFTLWPLISWGWLSPAISSDGRYLSLQMVFVQLSTIGTVVMFVAETRKIHNWAEGIPECCEADWKQLLSRCFSKLPQRFRQSLKVVGCVFFVLSASGGYWLQYLAALLSTEVQPDQLRFLGILWDLLSFKLFVLSIMTQVFVDSLLRTIPESFAIWMSQTFTFPIPDLQMVNDPNLVYLQLAMMAKELPLLQRLAFRDFAHMAEHSVLRRSRLFAVSQPGSHPRNWNDIVTICVGQMDQLRLGLEQTVATLAAQSNVVSYHNRMGQRPFFSQDADGTGLSSTLNRSVAAAEESFRRADATGPIDKPSAPSDSVSQCFSNLNANIWNIEALGMLLKASYKEDQFGVVQKDLVKIVGGFCDIHLALEKLCRLTGCFPPRPASEDLLERRKLRLHLALESALVKVVSTFGVVLLNMPFSHSQFSTLRKLMANEGVIKGINMAG